MTSPKPSATVVRPVAIVLAIALASLVLIALRFTVPSLSKKAAMKMPDKDLAQGPMDRPAIPPIDAAAPADVETATFALG